MTLNRATVSPNLHLSCLPVPVTRHALLNALCLPSIAEFVSYHYYRAQGWWVRSGVKYGTDWTLYENSPSMSHSKYAVLVVPAVVQIPAEQSEYCSSGENDQRDVTVDNDGCSQLPVGLRVLHQGKIIGWSDYFTSLRLLVNVKKRLRLCFVVAPLERVDTGKSRNVAVANDGFAPSADTASYTALLDTTLGAGWQDLLARLYADPDACLDFYRVLEFDFSRWTPDRTR